MEWEQRDSTSGKYYIISTITHPWTILLMICDLLLIYFVCSTLNLPHCQLHGTTTLNACLACHLECWLQFSLGTLHWWPILHFIWFTMELPFSFPSVLPMLLLLFTYGTLTSQEFRHQVICCNSTTTHVVTIDCLLRDTIRTHVSIPGQGFFLQHNVYTYDISRSWDGWHATVAKRYKRYLHLQENDAPLCMDWRRLQSCASTKHDPKHFCLGCGLASHGAHECP